MTPLLAAALVPWWAVCATGWAVCVAAHRLCEFAAEPGPWCSCGEYRVQWPGGVCPICKSEAAKKEAS